MSQKHATKIDLSLVWDDAKAMGSANRDLLTAISGMFLLLPLILATQFISVPEGRIDPKASDAVLMASYRAFVEANWLQLLGLTLTMSFGMLAILALLLRRERLTVAESLKAGLIVLPSYLVANMLQNLVIQGGLILFVIPALYFSGRLALTSAVAAAEKELNPLTMLTRGFTLTRGNGWRIFGVLAVIGITMGIAGFVLMVVTGVLSELILPSDLADFAVSFVGCLILSGILLIITLVTAALYRSATAPVIAPWAP